MQSVRESCLPDESGDEKGPFCRLPRTLPCEGGGRVGIFHHPSDRDVKTLSRFPQRKKSFEVLVRLRWAMKNALVQAPPFG
jgi:hypothetical protein